MVDIDVAKWAITSGRLCRDGDFDFNTRDEIDRGSNDLDYLGRRVQVDVPLVDLHLVTVPGLRTFTTRRLTGGDGKDLRRVTNRALDAELLVLRFVDEVRGEFLQAGDLARREGDPDFVQLCGGHLARCVVLLFSLSDVTHLLLQIVSGD